MSTSSLFMERVRLEDGYHEDDLPFIERTLTQLFHHLERFDPSMVYIGLRVKDRGNPACAPRSSSASAGCRRSSGSPN